MRRGRIRSPGTRVGVLAGHRLCLCAYGHAGHPDLDPGRRIRARQRARATAAHRGLRPCGESPGRDPRRGRCFAPAQQLLRPRGFRDRSPQRGRSAHSCGELVVLSPAQARRRPAGRGHPRRDLLLPPRRRGELRRAQDVRRGWRLRCDFHGPERRHLPRASRLPRAVDSTPRASPLVSQCPGRPRGRALDEFL